MKLLDLFCGAGGAAMGYYRSGFADITGIDNRPQKHYPFRFILADALEYLAEHGREYDVIHASPPCQGYSACKTMHTSRCKTYPMLIPDLRARLSPNKIWIIENVYGSPLINSVMLCGLSFNLKLFRHRYFECSMFLSIPQHQKHNGHVVGRNGYVSMVGHGDSGQSRIPSDHRTIAA